jgi:hypothetical protein
MPLEECPVQVFNFKGGIDMNRFTFAGLMLFALLLVAPIASAQEGWSGCPWGAAYDPMVQGYLPACFSRPADNAAALKPAGLVKPAPAESFDPCGFSEQLDLLLDSQALACLSQPFPAAKAASKPAGLAAPAPVAIPMQGWSGCPWGTAYDPMAHGFIAECFRRPTDNAAALKPAGLAKPAPAENFDPCGFSEQLDLLLDPLALACLSQPFPAARAASKPAGLAAPEMTAKQNQDGPGCAPGYFYYIVGPGDQGDCFPESIWTASATATAAASKPAGRAAPAPPQQQFGPCGFGEWLDPLLDPLALACLR